MKPSKLLKNKNLCRWMASVVLVTFVFSCDNASKREVKSKLNNQAKVQKQDSLDRATKCTPEILELISDRTKTVNDIEQLIKISEDTALSEAQKNQLTSLIEELKTKSDLVIEQIKKTKAPNGATLTGCYKENATSQTTRLIYSIRSIKETDIRLANLVQQITKKTNSILEAEQKENENTQNINLLQTQNYKVSAALGEALTEANKDGRMYILEGEIHATTEAATELTNLLEVKNKSVCYLEATSGKLEADTAVTVVSVTSEPHETENTTQSLVIFQGEESKMFILKCQLATKEEVPQALRIVLKDLITLQ